MGWRPAELGRRLRQGDSEGRVGELRPQDASPEGLADRIRYRDGDRSGGGSVETGAALEQRLINAEGLAGGAIPRNRAACASPRLMRSDGGVAGRRRTTKGASVKRLRRRTGARC
jgi:hypothetical protein